MEPKFEAPRVTRARWFGEPELQRALFRCDACLSTLYMAGDEDVREWMECPICKTGYKMCFEGWLRDGRIKRVVERLACDPSCNHARGVECECPCGGQFHGTGVTVTFRQLLDAGNAPEFLDIDVEAARRTAQEFIEAARPVRAFIRMTREKMDNKVWIPRPQFDALRAAEAGLARARSLKTQKNRLAVLARVASNLPAVRA